MRLPLHHALAIAAVVAAAVLGIACSLNPQPLPPDNPGDASAGGNGASSPSVDGGQTFSDAAARADSSVPLPAPSDAGGIGFDASGIDAGAPRPPDASVDGEAGDAPDAMTDGGPDDGGVATDAGAD